MPAKRSLTLALALLFVAAIPAQASAFPTMTIADDIQPGTGSSTPLWSAGRLGDYLYTLADDGVTGYELWRTNGVTSTQVANINTNSSDGSYPTGFTVLGDWLYFQADDGTHGYELWRTNGTTTALVQDINTNGTDSSSPSGFTAFGGWLYFSATDATHGYELWRTNGTSTELFINIDSDESDGPSSYPNNFTEFGDWLYFQASDGIDGAELWRTNGTITAMVANINVSTNTSSNPSGFTVLGDWLYFSALDSTTGVELWRTNGTTTERVANINAGSSDSNPGEFEALGNWLYFRADDGTTGTELWRTNGTTTTRVADINTTGTDSSAPYGLTALGGYVYFNATVDDTWKLWRVSAEGTVEPSSPTGTDVFFGCMCDRPILTLNGRLFAQMYTAESGFEFIYFDEPTYGLPLTNRDGSVWSTALVLLAAVTAVAGVGLRMRGVRHVAS